MRRSYERVIEWLAAVMVSRAFITLFFGTIIAWIAWNRLAPASYAFDPPSGGYIRLNLVMSAIAGIQATAVAIAARKADAAQERHRREIERRHDAHEQQIMETEVRVLQRLDEIESRLLGDANK